jgi:hypothetical protein
MSVIVMENFSKYWAKGWKVAMLLALCNATMAFTVLSLSIFFGNSRPTLLLILLVCCGVLVLPAVFYWIYVQLFGEYRPGRQLVY